jgi:hypothetical protein
LVKDRDLLIKPGDVLEQQCTELGNSAWQPAARGLYLGCEPANMKNPLWRNNPMFRQMTAQGVDRLRSLPDQ